MRWMLQTLCQAMNGKRKRTNWSVLRTVTMGSDTFSAPYGWQGRVAISSPPVLELGTGQVSSAQIQPNLELERGRGLLGRAPPTALPHSCQGIGQAKRCAIVFQK